MCCIDECRKEELRRLFEAWEVDLGTWPFPPRSHAVLTAVFGQLKARGAVITSNYACPCAYLHLTQLTLPEFARIAK